MSIRTQAQPVFERAREATFLITCLRGLSPPVSEDIHWQALERMARENGVLPLLWHSLQRAGVEMAEAFVAAALESRKAAERLASELDRLLPLFGERGIEVLPLKGPAIALELYGDAALRSCKDLDLLVRRNDFSRGEALLQEHGFIAGAINESERRFLREGISVELHFDIASPNIYRFDLDGIWERSRREDYRGSQIRAMSREDLVLFLSSHGLSHGFARLIWILDLARALDGLDKTGCRRLTLHAERAGLLPWFLIGCEVVRAMFPNCFPDALNAAIAKFPREAERARRAAARLFAEGLGGVAGTYRSSYLESRGGAIARWRHRWSYLSPTAEDYRWADCHGIDRRLMPILRPFRLLQKYGPARAWRVIFPARI